MNRYFKFFCIILALLLLFSFISSCFPRDQESIFDSIFNPRDESESESEFENSETSSTDSTEVAPNPFSSLTMACLGDSITMGAKIKTAYPDVVKDILGLDTVYNYGISWSTVGYNDNCPCHNGARNHDPYVFRYEQMENADIIAVMGGANDLPVCVPIGDIDDTEPTTFYGALNILASGLKSTYPDSYIFFMTNFNYITVNSNGDSRADYNDAIRAICAKYDIDCLDIWNIIPFDQDSDTVDGVHPTQDFVTNVWSPVIADFIKENYNK